MRQRGGRPPRLFLARCFNGSRRWREAYESFRVRSISSPATLCMRGTPPRAGELLFPTEKIGFLRPCGCSPGSRRGLEQEQRAAIHELRHLARVDDFTRGDLGQVASVTFASDT